MQLDYQVAVTKRDCRLFFRISTRTAEAEASYVFDGFDDELPLRGVHSGFYLSANIAFSALPRKQLTYRQYNVGRMLNDSEKTLRHTASNMFRKRGVSEGDSLYIITVKRGQLLVLCKLIVSDMCGYEEAVRLLKNEDLWPAEDHILADTPAAIRRTFEVPVPLTITKQLRFQSYPQNKSLRFVEPGILDQFGGTVCREGPIVEAFPNAFLAVLMPKIRNAGGTNAEAKAAFRLTLRTDCNDGKAGIAAVQKLGSARHSLEPLAPRPTMNFGRL